MFAGSGLSGLTLALELARRPFFRDIKIILIDRDNKSRNDRTWCFWAKSEEPLPNIVHKTWGQCLFFGNGVEKTLDIAPYRYHMIRGLDFYQWAIAELAQFPNIQRIQTNILAIDAAEGIVRTDAGDFQGEWVFNSSFIHSDVHHSSFRDRHSALPANHPTKPAPQDSTFLLQHFKGWIIETPIAVFNPDAVTFMDYRLDQHRETRFVYVLPLSETRALVEFTVFSPELCPAEEYDSELRRYISGVLKIKEYQVEEEEFGVIPMTDLPLLPSGVGRVINIGTPGGFVKASSGYAFLRTQRKLRAFADAWERTGKADATILQSKKGFRALDSIMLRVLRDGLVSGSDFFSLLFKKLPAPLVFRFLDEDASLVDVIRVLSAPPSWPFFKAAIRQLPALFKLLRSKH